MNSPLYTFPSDISTPKPEHVYRHEEFNNEEFTRYLTSLVDDINALGKQTENLRTENQMLKKQLEISQREKEKHINFHAREKFELEKTIAALMSEKKELMRDLKFYKEKFEDRQERQRFEMDSGVKEYFSEKSLRSAKVRTNLDIKGKINKMEKEQKALKKKVRELENGGNKSGILRWNTEV
jgi:chromosome segregation ATPase